MAKWNATLKLSSVRLCSQFLVSVTSARSVRIRRNARRSQFGNSRQLLRTHVYCIRRRRGARSVVEEFQLERFAFLRIYPHLNFFANKTRRLHKKTYDKVWGEKIFSYNNLIFSFYFVFLEHLIIK